MPGSSKQRPEDPQGKQEHPQEGRESRTGYVISLPERLVRTTAAGAGGLLLEATDHILPPPVREAKIYQCLIARPLRITVEAVGGVSGRFPMEDISGQEMIQRKVAGNFVEAFSVFTVGFSPLWFLAVASDVTGGTRVYLDAFVKELKKAKVLPDSIDISSVDDLLAVLDRTVGQAADAIDIPPTAISDMRGSVELMRESAELIPGPQRLADLFHPAECCRQGTETVTTGSFHAGGCGRDPGWHAPGQRSYTLVLCGSPRRHSQGGSFRVPRAHQPSLRRRRLGPPQARQAHPHAPRNTTIAGQCSNVRAGFKQLDGPTVAARDTSRTLRLDYLSTRSAGSW